MATYRLPQWQSHKIVHAAKITGLIYGLGGEGIHSVRLEAPMIPPSQEFQVPENFAARGKPQVGDYLVQYDDGYVSWSPAKAFEDGYTRI